MSDSDVDTVYGRSNGRELAENRENPAESSPRYKLLGSIRENVTRTVGPIVLIALLTVIAVAVPAPLLAAADGSVGPSLTPDPDGSNETVAAGEHLSGSLSVQRESVDRNLSQRTVTVTVASAPTDDAKAVYLAGECERLHRSVQSLEQRATMLKRARSNDSITPGEFRARMTEIDARAETVEQLSATCLRSGRSISNESLSRSGFNVTAIRESRRSATTFRRERLADHTLNLSVRNVSGATVAVSGVLTSESLTNATDEQREQLAEATARRELLVERNESAASFVAEHGSDDDEAADALSCASEELEAARDAIEAAKTSAENGDDRSFSDHMASAREHMDAVEECIELAYEEAGN